MKDLQNAAVGITTRLSVDSGDNDGNVFYLDDYSSLEELFADCAGWFIYEDDPEYIYDSWENIPDCMIREEWISPNFFIIREGLKQIEALYRDMIWGWCRSVGLDIANDDPHKILYDFECAVCGLPVPREYPEYGNEADGYPCDADEYYPDCYEEHGSSYCMIDHTGHSFEMFDENYN